MTETFAYGYSSESAQREFNNKYQYDRVLLVSNFFCVLVLWTKVASDSIRRVNHSYDIIPLHLMRLAKITG